MTRSGWRSKITVRPPSGIWATTEAATPAALHRIQPGSRGHPARRDRRDRRARHGAKGHDAVSELHQRVKVLLGKGCVAAAGPVVAAEAGGRQAHDRAGRNDDEERPERDRGEAPESRRRDRASAAPSP